MCLTRALQQDSDPTKQGPANHRGWDCHVSDTQALPGPGSQAYESARWGAAGRALLRRLNAIGIVDQALLHANVGVCCPEHYKRMGIISVL